MSGRQRGDGGSSQPPGGFDQRSQRSPSRSMRGESSGSVARSMRHWPLLVVVIGVAAGLTIAVSGPNQWRLGCLVLGCALGIGAVERFALPRNEAGLLQVRSKAFDVVVLLLAGAAVVALAILVPSGR